MHLDDERIQRALHGELGPAEAETRLHLASCTGCRIKLEEARAEEDRILSLLSRIDQPAPRLDPRVLFAGRGSAPSRWGRAAAVLVGIALAGVAYATPGSPLPGMLDRLLGGGRAAQEVAPAPAIRSEDRSPAAAGIAVSPAGGLVIRLVSEGGDAVATIGPARTDEVVVRAVEGNVTFASDPGRVTVRSSGAARIEILIPPGATSVEVRAGTAPVFRKLAQGAVTTLPRDSAGRYTIHLPSTAP